MEATRGGGVDEVLRKCLAAVGDGDLRADGADGRPHHGCSRTGLRFLGSKGAPDAVQQREPQHGPKAPLATGGRRRCGPHARLVGNEDEGVGRRTHACKVLPQVLEPRDSRCHSGAQHKHVRVGEERRWAAGLGGAAAGAVGVADVASAPSHVDRFQ